MAKVVVRAPAEQPFREAFARIRDELAVPVAFPDAVLREADEVAHTTFAADAQRRDARNVPLVSIDPAGSRDLDQAFHAERLGAGGHRVHYAIADVAAFVRPGVALDNEAARRGVTVYLPDGRAPMLPAVLSEGAASLLPGEDRPAVLWTIELDAHGETVSTQVERALVRNRAALAFDAAQRALDEGTADDALALLRDIGTRRRELEAQRNAISLDLPAQEVVGAGRGAWTLEYRAPLPVETWNAQISLLAGMEAAKLLIAARTGILRTLAAPEPSQLDRLRRSAAALGVAWAADEPWAAVARRLDRTRPTDGALLIQAMHVLRGASYVALDASNASDPATIPIQAGVGAPYAHVTAPLRRYADRYDNEIVIAACAGVPPPEWAVAGLQSVAATMQAASHHASAIERAVIDAVECVLLVPHVGEEFAAVVIDRNAHGIVVQLTDPAVVATVDGDAGLGERVRAHVDAVDPVTRRIELHLVR